MRALNIVSLVREQWSSKKFPAGDRFLEGIGIHAQFSQPLCKAIGPLPFAFSPLPFGFGPLPFSLKLLF
jgi:hypothetical protein